MKRKILHLATSLTLAAALMTPIVVKAAPSYYDVPGHWAEAQIMKWSEKSVLSGYAGYFRPNDAMTRGDLAIVLDKIMKYQTTTQNSYKDLPQEAYYTPAVLRAAAAGVITADEGYIRANQNLTRQEAAVMVAKALNLAPASSTNAELSDLKSISSANRGYVYAVLNAGYMNGHNDGTFEPNGKITRAQVMSIINNAAVGYYDQAKTYTGSVSGTAIVNTSGATLKDLTVNGDLVIAQGVGNGEVTLDNVKVSGTTYVRGGGSNSVIVKNSKLERVNVSKSGNAAVSIKLASSAEIVNLVAAESEQKVNVQGKVGTVTAQAKSSVNLVSATVTNVTVVGKNAVVSVGSGTTVRNLTVEEDASNTVLTVSGTVNSISNSANSVSVTVSSGGKVTSVSSSVSLHVDGSGKVGSTSSNVTVSGGTTTPTSEPTYRPSTPRPTATTPVTQALAVTSVSKPTADGIGTGATNINKYTVSAVSNNSTTITATEALVNVESADSTQGAAKWVGVLITTNKDVNTLAVNTGGGFVDLSDTDVEEALTAGATGSKTFVWWLKSENIGTEGKVIAIKEQGKADTTAVDFTVNFVPFVAAQAAPAFTNATVAEGSADNTTKVTVGDTLTGSLKYKVSNATVATPNVGDAVTGVTAYTSGADISGVDATTNKYLAIYEVDASNNVVKFKLFTLTAADIKAPAVASKISGVTTVTAGNAGTTEVKGVWTLAVTTACGSGDKVTINGTEYTYVESNPTGNQFTGVDATAQAASLATVLNTNLTDFDVTAATGTITFTQQVGGTGAAPTASIASGTGAIGAVTLRTAGNAGTSETLGVYTVQVTTNLVAGNTITIAGKTLNAVASGAAAGTSFVPGATIDATVTNIVAALASNMPTGYAVTGATNTLTLTQTTGNGSATAPTVTVAQGSTVAVGVVGAVGTTTAGVAAVTEATGVWTLTIATAFAENEEVTINNTTYKCTTGGSGANEFAVGSSASEQASSLQTLLETALTSDFTVTVNGATITITQATASVDPAKAVTATVVTSSATGTINLQNTQAPVVEVAETLGVYTAQINANLVVGNTITIAGKSLTAVESNPVVGTSFVPGATIDATVTNILAALVGNMPTNYEVTGATDTLTLTQTVGHGSATAPTVTVAQGSTVAVGVVGAVNTSSAGASGTAAVQGEWTLAVTAAFAVGDKVTVNGVDYVHVAGTPSANEFTGDDVTAQAASLATALGTNLTAFNVTAATGTITFTQKVGGTGVAPTAAVASGTGTLGAVTLVTTGVAGTTAVKGVYTLTINEPLIAGDVITVNGTDYTFGTTSGFGTGTTVTDQATELATLLNTALTAFDVTSNAGVITFTQATAGTGTAPTASFTAATN